MVAMYMSVGLKQSKKTLLLLQDMRQLEKREEAWMLHTMRLLHHPPLSVRIHMNECAAYGPASVPVTERGAEEDTALYETVHGD
jgi:hypothetical protein